MLIIGLSEQAEAATRSGAERRTDKGLLAVMRYALRDARAHSKRPRRQVISPC